MRRWKFRPLTTRQIVFDAVAAVLFVPVFSLGMIDPLFYRLAGSDQFRLFGFVVVLILAAALAVRRLSPGLSLAIAWAAAITQMAMGLDPQLFDIAIFCVLYATAAYGSRVVMWTGLASAVVGALVASGYMVLVYYWLDGSAADGGIYALQSGVVWFVAFAFALLLSWTTGALVRSSLAARANRREKERAEIERAGEQERGRIARDMHDVVAHSLAVVVAQADGARYAADADPEAVKEALATISQTARSALTDVRLLLAQLRHRQGDGPQPTLADLEGLFAQVRGAGTALAVDIDPVAPGEPPTSVQLAVYRILQEALTNALRHGDGAEVDVRMSWLTDRMTLRVSNLAGEADPASGGARGHGVVGMTERAQLVGGSLTAAPDGRMFVVRAELPVSGYATRGAEPQDRTEGAS